VSDVSQGPGWWQASDGKWYPPQPAATPPPMAPPPGPGPGPQWGGPPPAKKSNKGCLIALAVVGVVALLGIAAVVAVVLAVEDEVDDRVDDANRDGGIPTFSDNTENPPGDDVTVADCGPAPDTGLMRATVDVLNHSSEPSNYIITVAFEADDGSRQLATSTALVNGLGPDQTTNAEANSFQTAPDGVDFSCSINQVQRFAA
jgi:hypothetical protein